MHNSLAGEISLREVIASDLPLFHEHQQDPEAVRMAAFPTRDKEAFMGHWARILADKTVFKQTILFNGKVAGNIVSWQQDGMRKVGYWLGKEFWGRGIATRALLAFLDQVTERPLYAHVAKHNVASLRVLEKCGYTVYGEGQMPAAPPYDEIEEYMMVLK